MTDQPDWEGDAMTGEPPRPDDAYDDAVRDKAYDMAEEIENLRAALHAIEVHGGSGETYDPIVDAICRGALEGEDPTITMAQIRAAVDRGDVNPAGADSPETDLPDGFWDDAEKVPVVTVVTVKPLVWDDDASVTYGGPWTILLTSHGSPSGDKLWRGKNLGSKHGATEHLGYHWHETREEAKAAARAHHEAAILSAIDVQPTWRGMEGVAQLFLSDDILLSRMAKAMHDGPLQAGDYEYRADTKAGGWCLDCIREGLKAIATPPSEGA